MAPLKPFEQIDAGGVDSRSNPVNLPRNRALRCNNWAPKQAGFWELRWGYDTVSMSTVSTASAIHSIFPYRTWAGGKFVLFMQGTQLKTLNAATGVVTSPVVLGAAMASSAKGAGYFANNRFQYGNGTDQKWFDGTTWRDNGLPAFTFTQALTVTITEGVRELTPAQATAITLTAAAGGTFPADILTGRLIYVVLFDTTTNEIGPATISVGTGRVVVTLNQKITVAVMPNLAAVNANWVKLIAGTIDGGNLAFFFTNTVNNIQTAAAPGTTLTVTTTAAHGLATGDVVEITSTNFYDGIYAVTVTGATTFTCLLPASGGGLIVTTGRLGRIVKAANATTTVDVLGPSLAPAIYQANQDRGLPASTIGSVTAGYQFFASIYNPNGGGHVGNRFQIGGRALQTAYRSNWHINGLPDMSIVDPAGEQTVLIGRTGDGALVPYVVADNDLNWLFVANGKTSVNVTDAAIDGNHEMPTRNGIIPAETNMFCLAGDFCYAADTGSATLRRSGSLADDRAGLFTGRPEQSWAPNDIDTFPTGEATTGLFEIDQEVLMGTLNDTALSVNLAGIQQWVGPWPIGIAGRRAGTKCGAYGFFWVTGDKQLATFEQGVPVIASEEYQAAELKQIGDAFLSTVECVYYRNADKNKDELRIEAQKEDGTPYTIIHDFKLRDGGAPVSLYGQGYSAKFEGPLGIAFTSALIRDGNGALQVYAGDSLGQLYKLYTGANDAGTEYDADLILLVNGGPTRPDVPSIDFYGDSAIEITVGRNFQTSLAAGSTYGFDPPNADANVAQAVPGAEQDFRFRVFFTPPEIQRWYVRFQLTSHSADGNLELNDPPHVPLEDYGRLYELVPAYGDERDF